MVPQDAQQSRGCKSDPPTAYIGALCHLDSSIKCVTSQQYIGALCHLHQVSDQPTAYLGALCYLE